MTAPLGEGRHLVAKYGHPAGRESIWEDSDQPRLGTAMVELVLPSTKSAQLDGPGYREPSPDQARFGCQ